MHSLSAPSGQMVWVRQRYQRNHDQCQSVSAYSDIVDERRRNILPRAMLHSVARAEIDLTMGRQAGRQAGRQWQSTRRWSNLIIISEGFLLMRNGYTIIDRSSSSSSTTLCNITGQLSVGRRVWKLVTHQINQFLSFHHHYIISNQKHHCTALHCEYEATKMLMMDAMVCCISSVAVQNGDWKESADCRSNAEGISTKA